MENCSTGLYLDIKVLVSNFQNFDPKFTHRQITKFPNCLVSHYRFIRSTSIIVLLYYDSPKLVPSALDNGAARDLEPQLQQQLSWRTLQGTRKKRSDELLHGQHGPGSFEDRSSMFALKVLNVVRNLLILRHCFLISSSHLRNTLNSACVSQYIRIWFNMLY